MFIRKVVKGKGVEVLQIAFEASDEETIELMKRVYEEGRENGKLFPSLTSHFFEGLLPPPGEVVGVEFEYVYLEFIRSFFEELHSILKKAGVEAPTVEDALRGIDEWRVGGWHVQCATVQ